MSINFATLQGLTIPEGVVTRITDAAGRVLWQVSDREIVLEVKKITSNTLAGETTYTDEQFVLLNIYPKTNGTVSVTYGGLTKTITDTSGTESPNAQSVFFGTFNGVSDSVTTPDSGTLTIAGDCAAFGVGTYSANSKGTTFCDCVTAITECFGSLVTNAFGNVISDCPSLTSVNLSGLTSIQRIAIPLCSGLTSVLIPASVKTIGHTNFIGFSKGYLTLSVAKTNAYYHMDGNCLIEKATNCLLNGCADSTIPTNTKQIATFAFYTCTGLTSIVIPASVTSIGDSAFYGCTGLKSVTFENPSGWTVTKAGGTATSLDELSDPANNATLLVSTYSLSCTWSRA